MMIKGAMNGEAFSLISNNVSPLLSAGGTSSSLTTSPSTRSPARRRQLRVLGEHIAEDGLTVFTHACQLGAERIVSKKIESAYESSPCRVWIKVRKPATSPYSGSQARSGIDEARAVRADDHPAQRRYHPR
jgi:hypothetical protein